MSDLVITCDPARQTVTVGASWDKQTTVSTPAELRDYLMSQNPGRRADILEEVGHAISGRWCWQQITGADHTGRTPTWQQAMIEELRDIYADTWSEGGFDGTWCLGKEEDR